MKNPELIRLPGLPVRGIHHPRGFGLVQMRRQNGSAGHSHPPSGDEEQGVGAPGEKGRLNPRKCNKSANANGAYHTGLNWHLLIKGKTRIKPRKRPVFWILCPRPKTVPQRPPEATTTTKEDTY